MFATCNNLASVGLLDVRPQFKPQLRHRNEIWKYISSVTSSLCRFLAKNRSVNKTAMKSFSKKSVVRNLILRNCIYRLLMYKINTHNTSDVRSYVNNPGWRFVMTNYVSNDFNCYVFYANFCILKCICLFVFLFNYSIII